MERGIVLAITLFVSQAVSACSCSPVFTILADGTLAPEPSLEERVARLMEASAIVGVFDVAGTIRSSRTTLTEVREDMWLQQLGLIELTEGVRAAAVDEVRRERTRWVVLQPAHLFKGEPEPMLVAQDLGLCDPQYREGKALLVYAERDRPANLSTCSASGPMRDLAGHVAVLWGRPGSPP